MNRQKAIAVIGGGIIGATAAWRLAQRGFNVTIYEKGKLGSESSWAGAGMLSTGEMNEPFEHAELFLQSRKLYSAFVAELAQMSGVGIDYRECGAIDLAYSAEEWCKLRQRAVRQQAFSIEAVK